MPIKPMTSSAAAMHGAVVPIAYIVANGTANEYIFSNIPQKYQDLMVVINAQTVSGTGSPYWYAMAYGSPAPSWTRLYGNGSSAVSDRVVSGSSGNVSNYNYSSLSNTYPTSAVMHFLNYANTSTYKTVLTRGAGDFNGSGSTSLNVTLLASTSAITLIDIATFSSANFATGSTFTLYGIRTVGQ